MPRRPRDAYAVLEGHLGHTFADPLLLESALTHRSYVNEFPEYAPHNERLEFLGDAVLGLVVAHLLMEFSPDCDEGVLSAQRARIVSEQALSAVATEIELGTWLFLGRGEVLTGGRNKPSLLADAFEAVLGAIYTERGFDYVLATCRRLLSPKLEEVLVGSHVDHKSMLQEWIQAQKKTRPRYEVLAEEGPSHEKIFEVGVWLDEMLLARGRGRSKREAGQNAAKGALDALLSQEAANR